MRQLFFILNLISICLFISCEKDNETDVIYNNNEKSGKRLKEILCDDNGLKSRTIFSYSNANKLEKCEFYIFKENTWDKSFEYTFTYLTDIIQIEQTYCSNFCSRYLKIIYQYNNDSILLSKTNYIDIYSDDKEIDTMNYEYDTSGRLTARSGNKVFDERYFWENDKIIKCSFYQYVSGVYREGLRSEYKYYDNCYVRTSLQWIGDNNWREFAHDSIVIEKSPLKYIKTEYTKADYRRETYTYDEDGYLIEYSYFYPLVSDKTIEYIYEKGTSDLDKIFTDPIKEAFNEPVFYEIEY